jgi:nucleoside-diphosphate-sugar epimerase
MPDSKRLVVTGVTGFIGREIASHFGARGWEVVGLARRPPRAPTPGVRFVTYELGGAFPVESLAGARALVHCAYARGEFDLNVAAARRLLEAAGGAGVARSIFLSSLSAKEGASSAYGRQKLAIERLFSEAHQTVVRPGLVVGNGGAFAAMRAHVRAGRPIPVIGDGRQPVQIVAVSDLLRALEIVIERDLTGVFVVAQAAAVPYRDFQAALARNAGVRARFVRVPYHLVRAALWLAEAVGLPLGLSKDSLEGLRAMTWVDPRPDLEHLGLQVKPFADALEELSP